ncbi:MAG TPA: hypothetical protein ENK65_00010 [Helicobacteraceae bacterium]|nr:hypothetical protein [Helicobacteraceae bacterium]
MQGKVLSFNLATGRGKITLKDGNVVAFTRDEWKLPIRPQANILVEYMRGDIVMPVKSEAAIPKQVTPKNSSTTEALSDAEVNEIIQKLEAKETVKKVKQTSSRHTKTETKASQESTKPRIKTALEQKRTPKVEVTLSSPVVPENARTRPLVKAAKGHIELMKEKAIQEQKRKEGCQAEAYIEKKLAEGYKLVEKDEQHFVLAQKHANRSILNRAQRWLLYTIPLFLAFIIFADDMSLARSILDTLLEINVILLLGTLATLYWQGYVSEAFKVEVKGNCEMDKLVVDDSQEVEFYMKRAA